MKKSPQYKIIFFIIFILTTGAFWWLNRDIHSNANNSNDPKSSNSVGSHKSSVLPSGGKIITDNTGVTKVNPSDPFYTDFESALEIGSSNQELVRNFFSQNRAREAEMLAYMLKKPIDLEKMGSLNSFFYYAEPETVFAYILALREKGIDESIINAVLGQSHIEHQVANLGSREYYHQALQLFDKSKHPDLDRKRSEVEYVRLMESVVSAYPDKNNRGKYLLGLVSGLSPIHDPVDEELYSRIIRNFTASSALPTDSKKKLEVLTTIPPLVANEKLYRSVISLITHETNIIDALDVIKEYPYNKTALLDYIKLTSINVDDFNDKVLIWVKNAEPSLLRDEVVKTLIETNGSDERSRNLESLKAMLLKK